MTVFNNINLKLGDDLKLNLNKTSKLKLCAAYFSIFAYSELKKELSDIKEFNFLFNSPTFLNHKNEKQQKLFYIPPYIREKAISGTEFEVKLKNELNQKVIAKECKAWAEKKCVFKTLKKNTRTNDGLFLENKDKTITYANFDSFSSNGLGYEENNDKIRPMYPKIEGEFAKQYVEQFNQVWNNKELVEDVSEKVISYITSVYDENSPEYLYFITLYNIFNEFLEDINEDNLANEKTGFKNTEIWKTLYNFQKDAVIGGISKLEKYNGCVLADSVGLGKTYTALGIIKYFELRNKQVLVLCPKRLSENWTIFTSKYKTNTLVKDRFNYDVLYHTDLSRNFGYSNSLDLERVNWENYDLVVIDESHNFRNDFARKNKETRYQKLMNKVIRAGVKTKVLMLSATPVNNKFKDLKNQLALAYEGDTKNINSKLNTSKDIESIFREAQATFKSWSKLDSESRTTKSLLDSLSFDFFELLDAVTIARSRKHITKYYDTKDIGEFPIKKKPINKDFVLTNLKDVCSFEDIFNDLSSLNLSFYTPSLFILSDKKEFYEEKYDTQLSNSSSLKQSTRESGIMRLMRVNLLKRLESSIEAFRHTLKKLNSNLKSTLNVIDQYHKTGSGDFRGNDLSNLEDDEDLENIDFDNNSTIGTKIKIRLEDMDTLSWQRDLKEDQEKISTLIDNIEQIDSDNDSKLKGLIEVIENKIKNPINDNNNKKVVVFSAFADTVYYIYNNISKYFLEKYNINTACVSGSNQNQTTLKSLKNKEMNRILTYFSPISKNRAKSGLDTDNQIDILIATDCISEGQNLQDCDYLINYDIHWNPVRIIQRFGRIDRIGSKNKYIQLVNFWPPIDLDEYLNLKSRVEDKMIAGNLTNGGEENVISKENSVDLEYRKKQLKKLHEEVVELEDIDNSISITDLGLNDFRTDLITYFKEKGEINNTPSGLHAIVNKKDFESGVIFVLKNINPEINIDNINRLHPFYLVYVSMDGKIISNHLNVKNTLDIFRALSKNKIEPNYKLCKEFNKETKDGRNMKIYSELLQKAIESIINVKEDKDLNSIFSSGGTSVTSVKIRGIEDFELIDFLVIK